MARIILAEDDEIMGELIVDCLSRAGHAVGWLRNGHDALDAIRFRIPHLIILDQHMPRMSGGQVLRELRIRQNLAMIPVMMLTAVNGDADQNIAFFDGADDYLTKPFKDDDLIFRARALINCRIRRTMSDVIRR